MEGGDNTRVAPSLQIRGVLLGLPSCSHGTAARGPARARAFSKHSRDSERRENAVGADRLMSFTIFLGQLLAQQHWAPLISFGAGQTSACFYGFLLQCIRMKQGTGNVRTVVHSLMRK